LDKWFIGDVFAIDGGLEPENPGAAVDLDRPPPQVNLVDRSRIGIGGIW
jgi:hypothetical protein